MIIRHCTRLLLVALLLTGLLSCGQKGSLYLPDDPERREEQRSFLQR